jgi:hypothetical protein
VSGAAGGVGDGGGAPSSFCCSAGDSPMKNNTAYTWIQVISPAPQALFDTHLVNDVPVASVWGSQRDYAFHLSLALH